LGGRLGTYEPLFVLGGELLEALGLELSELWRDSHLVNIPHLVFSFLLPEVGRGRADDGGRTATTIDVPSTVVVMPCMCSSAFPSA
jgi:hypothetical protein